MHVGIDLGTTFSALAFIDTDNQAKIIPSSEGQETTPSVIWFDGNNAMVGEKVNAMKQLPGLNLQIYEFIKRDMGKPLENIAPVDGEEHFSAEPAPYEIAGFKYGAAGMSAIILKKLRIEAIRYLQNRGLLASDIDSKNFLLDAVITVPAYYGDKERQDTRMAGLAAGLNVIGIINEPTAAALAYGFGRQTHQKLLVFDLGGGTFDVTVLEINRGEAKVLASDGANTLGGKNWDEAIQNYLYNAFYEKNGKDIPDDKGFYIQQKALEAKFALTDHEETTVTIILENGDLEVTLYRSKPEGINPADEFSMEDDVFYFDERSTDLVGFCRRVCDRVMGKAGLKWEDLDEVILAGGACRMPMIHEMLEDLTRRKIKDQIKGFDLDTAVALGAAIYGRDKARVTDVVSHSVGVKVMENQRYIVDYFLRKNTQLPADAEKVYPADAEAVLAVYEGESIRPDECSLRGRIELDNPEGDVKIGMNADVNGMLKVVADYPPDGQKVIEIKNENFIFNDDRLKPLRDKIKAINIQL